jgi:N-acetylglutamate synthase-like GNAT family acetyltransferase
MLYWFKTSLICFLDLKNTNIIPYEAAHQSAIDSLMNEISLEFEEQINSKPTKETPIVPDNYWVFLNDEKVVGTVGVILVGNDFGVLKKMMLKKEFRGQDLGISALLLQTVERFCIENNASKLYLGTMLQFKAAQSFYVRNGFERISENQLPIGFLKNPLDIVFFVKKIKSAYSNKNQ